MQIVQYELDGREEKEVCVKPAPPRGRITNDMWEVAGQWLVLNLCYVLRYDVIITARPACFHNGIDAKQAWGSNSLHDLITK